MAPRLTPREKALAYVLHDEFFYPQRKIAVLMNTSQGTISNAIRDFKRERKIMDLENQLNEARLMLAEQGIGMSQRPLNYEDFV